uniref:Uncharacterized protein n=1 Tax=Entomoneis paludosa TaxID=265537 RepID=A0A7S2YL06_9STRA
MDSKESGDTERVLGHHVNPNFYGMIDQLVASRGKFFFGCWQSTFSGYINRLRGYHSQRHKEPGYEKGDLRTSFHYSPKGHFDDMRKYYPVRKPFYAREFPTAWRLLNHDTEDTPALIVG